MDATTWSQARYDSIVQSLAKYLKTVGFKKGKVHFVPISGFQGQNINSNVSDPAATWYNGPTLIEALDGVTAPSRDVASPHLRLSIANVFKKTTGNAGGLCVAGRVVCGSVQPGDAVVVQPCALSCTVKGIDSGGDTTAPWAVAGDIVTLTLSTAASDADLLERLVVGSVLCAPEASIPVVLAFEAQIVTFDVDIPITKGFSVVVHTHQRSEPAVMAKLHCTVNKRTNEPAELKPRCLGSNVSARVRVKLAQPLCVDTFASSKHFGRFLVRYGNATIAAGIILTLL
eukprot:m.759511 g.759511  ORF g.759511 m.759511 type:complete len:286 (+) comp23197_c0_seq1:2094-2951(+)